MRFKKLIATLLSGIIGATSLISTVAAEGQLLGYLGDVNYDMTISIADAVLLQKSLVTGLDGLPTDSNMFNADLNGDGRLDVFDVALLRRCVLGECEWKGIYSEEEEPTNPTEPTEETIEPTTELPTEPTTEVSTTATDVTETITTILVDPVDQWASVPDIIHVGEEIEVRAFSVFSNMCRWSTSDESILTVSSDGNMTATIIGISEGTVTLIANTGTGVRLTHEIAVLPAEVPTTTITTEIDIPETTTTTTALQMTLDDMPTEYKYPLDWVWENRIKRENSTGRWNTIFDQIVAGEGTLNYVVRWQSYKTVTLEQRKQFEVMLENSVNAWTDYLVGYDGWKYDHVEVNVVGWAVIDESVLLDRQPDEVVYTNCTYYDSQYDTSNGIETIPDKLPNAPDELSRMYHYDTGIGFDYPGGLDKRFDMYMWATQGFPSIGGCGGDWGQRLSDDAYLNMLGGVGVHVFEHELGHGFGITDFYGAEGATDGFPPGGFPMPTIMMAGNSAEITDYDGWQLRYIWSQIKDETNNSGVRRFN